MDIATRRAELYAGTFPTAGTYVLGCGCLAWRDDAGTWSPVPPELADRCAAHVEGAAR